MGRPSCRAPERSRSLMVVTVTVWLGWSYCTDSVFAVTSRSSSSASSVQGGCRTRPQPQDTSKQAPAHTPPLTPALESNGPLYSIEWHPGSHWLQSLACRQVLEMTQLLLSCSRDTPDHLVPTWTPGAAATPSPSRPQKLGSLLRIHLPRGPGLLLVSDPLTFRGT